MFILCRALPGAGFGGAGLHVELVRAVGDVFRGLAAGPRGFVGFVVGWAEGGGCEGAVRGSRESAGE